MGRFHLYLVLTCKTQSWLPAAGVAGGDCGVGQIFWAPHSEEFSHLFVEKERI